MSAAPISHQRVDGLARVAFARDANGRTRLADLHQRAPCRILFPQVEADEPVQAVLLTTSGGLTGGDRTRLEVAIGPGARATVTTQAAEKLYRALPGTADAQVDVGFAVGPDAWSEWLAQETILFDRARLRRSFEADVAPGGRLLAVESTVFGRTAMGERFDCGTLHDSWRIRRDGRLLWADTLRLCGDVRRQRAEPFGFGTAVACSTIVYVGADAPGQLAEARRLLDGSACEGGATAFDGLLLVRLLADQALALRAAVMALVAGLRRATAALPARLPRVWYC